MESAKFVISLDFELRWGVFDTLGESYNQNILGAREAVPKILELLEKYDIHATWATIGILFCENRDDFEKYKPKSQPTYTNKELNPYININLMDDEYSDKLHFGHSLIELILKYPNQEIASHSYSHYNCLAEGQTIEQFEDDTKSAIKIAKEKFNLELKSYVFAKNEINNDYLYILKQYGFEIFRSNPNHKLYNGGQKLNIFKKIIRVLDSYINISGNYNSTLNKKELYNTQGDRFLRPYRNKCLTMLMIRRIKNEMLQAAKSGNTYHLWWHPHNFGSKLEENLSNLENILKYFEYLNKKYKMESLCIRELM